MIRIDVPATSANLGSGFDSLGIALTMQNRVWMEESDTLEIRCTDNVKVPKHLYEICGKKLPGLKIIQENNIPMARGLGSSSACIVAGILGANRFMGNPLSQTDLINLAAQIEGHPDNTSPALSGGLVASAMEGKRVYSVSVPVQTGLQCQRACVGENPLCGDDPPLRIEDGGSAGCSAEDLLPRGRGVQLIPVRFDDGLSVFWKAGKPAGGGPGPDSPALPLWAHWPLRRCVPHEL